MNLTLRVFITFAYAWIPRPMFMLWRINFAPSELTPQNQGCTRSTPSDYTATFFEGPDGIRLEVTNYRQERRDRHDHWSDESADQLRR